MLGFHHTALSELDDFNVVRASFRVSESNQPLAPEMERILPIDELYFDFPSILNSEMLSPISFHVKELLKEYHQSHGSQPVILQ